MIESVASGPAPVRANCGRAAAFKMWSEIARSTHSVVASASKRSIRRFVITEKAPTRAFSWLKAATFTFKTLMQRKGQKGRAVWLA